MKRQREQKQECRPVDDQEELAGLKAVPRHYIRAGLRQCRDFKELFDLVRDPIEPIHGVGALMAYDTTIRLGAYLGLEPERVYLHAGTRHGAKALGFKGRDTIRVEELPAPLQQLEAYELEDCLCIYKEHLSGQHTPHKETTTSC